MTFAEPASAFPSLPATAVRPHGRPDHVSSVIAPELRFRLDRLVESHGCELLEVVFRGGRLQLVIDHPAGVTHDHCADVSREASVLLDAEDFGPGSGYVFEVSSPGLDRKLYGARDYDRFRGRRVRVTFTDGATNSRRTVRGELLGLGEDRPETALIREDDSGETLPLGLDTIEKARLLVEL